MNGSFDQNVVPAHLADGHLRHVAEALDKEPPWILRKIIPLLSSRVVIDEHVVKRLRELSLAGPIVYALKYRSMYDVHFLRMRFAALGLPVPTFVFGLSPRETGSMSKWADAWRGKIKRLIGHRHRSGVADDKVLSEVLGDGGAAVLFLVDERTSRERYLNPALDPIRILLDLQGRMAASIAVVPMFVLYDRRQPRVIRPFWETFLGDPDRPGPLRRILGAIRKWTIPEVLMGEPVQLVAQFEEFGSGRPWEDLPFEVRKDLVASINARIRVNRGPEKISRTEIKERVLQDGRVQRAVRLSVQRDPGAEQKIRKKAEAYVDEIAGAQHIQVHHFLYYVLKWLFSKMFDAVDVKESQFAMLKEKNQEGSLIYVSCHKSHIDYLLIGFLCFVNQMAIPYMAAGKNLSFWPVGPILRNAGAFFLRRSFKGLGLYPDVFAAYLKVLIKEHININFYIEGGRSRTGKLLPPRLGLLAFLLQAVKEEGVNDLTFVPTFVGYDQVPEEGSYLRELAGKEKQKETLISFLRSRDVLRKRYGRAYIRFDKPVSYKEFRDRFNATQRAEGASEDSRKLITEFAYHIMSGIVRAGVIAPIELVAGALFCAGRRRVSHESMQRAIDVFLRILRNEKFELADILDEQEKAVRTALGLFAMRGFIEVDQNNVGGKAAVYEISEEKRAGLQFYKNSLVCYLWPYSLFAAAVLKNGVEQTEISEDVRDDFVFLKDLMSKEVIWDPLITPIELVDRASDFCLAQGWVGKKAGSSTPPENSWVLKCLRGVLQDLFEVYYWALVAAKDFQGDSISLKDYTKRMRKAAGEHAGMRGDRFTPLFASVVVDNALSLFNEMGIVDYAASQKVIKGVADRQKANEAREFIAQAFDISS